jgi:hypothetical protein
MSAAKTATHNLGLLRMAYRFSTCHSLAANTVRQRNHFDTPPSHLS